MKKTLLAILLTSTALFTVDSNAAQSPQPPQIQSQGYGPVIVWPKKFTPGTTDNYVSNEVVVKGLTINDVWPLLTHASEWPTYYKNSSDIIFHKQGETELHMGTRFKFTTFGFPVESEVTEFQPSVNGGPARIAWHGWVEGDAEHHLDVHHAWLLENLPGGRLRILTEESQIGVPAQQLHNTLPNPMLNAHQLWLTGLVKAAEQAKK
ncbi:MAG: SRPBCC domain-containing protein [Pantoea sp.]|uniref:SRPBCC domain-containing protein n=1 Tax=Pantoea sp. TaxID=69393 RepID=UPI0039E70F54